MIELTLALALGSFACFVLFLTQAFLENRELEKMKREIEELEEMDLS